MNYILDTNIIIYSIKNSFPSIAGHFQNVACQSIMIPEIVMGEIEFGARKSRDYKKTITRYKIFTDTFEKISFDGKSAEYYGKIRNELEKKGCIIGSNDLIIAAIAMANNSVLVTHNIKEFARIDNLKIEDWTN